MPRLLDRPCPECQEHHGPNVRECPYMPSSYYAEDDDRDRDEDEDDTEPTSDEIDAWIEHCYGSR